MSFNNQQQIPNTYTQTTTFSAPVNNNNNTNMNSNINNNTTTTTTTTTNTVSSNITNITSVPGAIPQSSNSIHGPSSDNNNNNNTNINTNINNNNVNIKYEPNPGDIITIPVKMAAAGKKKCNIAKFHTAYNAPVVFSTLVQPVKMYRAPEEKEINEQPPPKENPFFKKKHPTYEKKVNKDPKAVPWRIEDGDAGFSYDGTLEGGQTSNYGLLVFENGAFTVTPIADWYNFRPRRSYQTYSTEEAEILMNNRQEQAKKRAEKMALNPNLNIKTEGGASGGAGGGAAPAAAGEDKEDAEFTTTHEDDDPDRFAAFGRADSDDEKKKKQQKQKSVKKEEDGESDNGEEPDWEGVFDDDEDTSANAPDEADPEPREDNEGDGEDKDLTEAGREMRTLLKRQKDDDISEGSEFGSDSDEEDDDDEEDFNLDEKLPFMNPMLKLNSTSDSKDDSSGKEEDSRPNSPPTGDSEKRKSPPGSKKKGKKDDSDTTTPKGEKSKKSSSRSKKSGDGKGAKREAGDIKSPPTTKKAKTETPKVDSPPLKSGAKTTGAMVTEEEVKRVLSQGKRLRTLDLVNHFKAALADETQKKKFTELTRKMCTIVDEGGVKYLLLRPQYL